LTNTSDLWWLSRKTYRLTTNIQREKLHRKTPALDAGFCVCFRPQTGFRRDVSGGGTARRVSREDAVLRGDCGASGRETGTRALAEPGAVGPSGAGVRVVSAAVAPVATGTRTSAGMR
jgi:hypothetical protein